MVVREIRMRESAGSEGAGKAGTPPTGKGHLGNQRAVQVDSLDRQVARAQRAGERRRHDKVRLGVQPPYSRSERLGLRARIGT